MTILAMPAGGVTPRTVGHQAGTPITQWFLTSRERGNPSTRLDTRHTDGVAWTDGNLVRPLIHGATYFAELYQAVSQMADGDLLMFTDWRGDHDERLGGTPDTEVGTVFADACRRGVDIRGLVCATAAATTSRTQATRRPSRWRRRTGRDRPGTTCSSPSADRPSVMWRRSSVSGGRTPGRSAAARWDGSRTGSGTTSRRPHRCRHNVPTPNRPDLIRCSCCAPTLAVSPATSSRLRANEAWRAATPRRSARRAT